MEKQVPVRSVRKALDVLDLLVEADLAGRPAPLADLAERLAMPVNSVHNLLKTMVACGYAEQRGRGLYVPGSKCRQLGQVNRLAGPGASEAVTAALQRFADAQGEACLLTVLVNGDRAVVRYVDCDQAVRVSRATVEKIPFFEKPTGRMLAAIADEAELQQILRRHGLPGARWNRIGSKAALRRELAALRKKGYCRTGPPGSPLVALACPVASPGQRAWGVAGTFAPSYRCTASREKSLLKALKKLAAELAAAVPVPSDGRVLGEPGKE